MFSFFFLTLSNTNLIVDSRIKIGLTLTVIKAAGNTSSRVALETLIKHNLA